MYKRSIEGWAKHWDFIILDTICLQCAYIIAFWIRFNIQRFVYANSGYGKVGIGLIFVSMFVAIICNTMHTVLRRNIWAEIKNTLAQCLLVFAIIAITLYSVKESEAISRIVVYITIGIYFILAFTTRMLYKYLLLKYRLFSKQRGMLLVCDQKSAKDTIVKINNRPEEGINILGLVLVDENDESEKESQIEGIPIVSTLLDAPDYILSKWIDEVYVSVSNLQNIPKELMNACGEMGVTVHQRLLAVGEKTGKQYIGTIAKDPVLTSSINIARPRTLAAKRLVDMVAGFFMSLIALIVLAIVTPIIKKQSPGPVLLKQERIGLNGKKIHIYQIRTMYMDAVEKEKEWKEHNPDVEPTIENDPRFIGNTNGKVGIGAKLRKSSLDDLPKGFSILFGTMSLVGVRAPSVAEWKKYEYRHRARLSCKPGLTGLWQASGNSKTMSFEEATALDTEYIRNWNLELDWKILIKTIALRQNKG